MPIFKITQEREVHTTVLQTAYVEAPDEIWLMDHTDDVEDMLSNDIGYEDELDYDCDVGSLEIEECDPDELFKYRTDGKPHHVFTKTPEEIEGDIENGVIPIPVDPRQLILVKD